MPALPNHLVRTRWSGEAEDVATESLAFLLNRSAAARQAFGAVFHASGFSFEAADLVFRTQRASTGVRPDISGITAEQELGLLVEGKFWAGFTEAQPVEYIRILEQEGRPGSGLAFLVPYDRLAVAWAELLRRLAAAGVTFTPFSTAAGTNRPSLRTDTGIHMMIASWEQIDAQLEPAVAAEPAVLADVLQLRAVCSDMRQDARSWPRL